MVGRSECWEFSSAERTGKRQRKWRSSGKGQLVGSSQFSQTNLPIVCSPVKHQVAQADAEGSGYGTDQRNCEYVGVQIRRVGGSWIWCM
jgi:hypothetical protein